MSFLTRRSRFGGAVVLSSLAIARAAFHLEGRMDTVFLGLVGVAIILAFLPLENLESVKAAGVELVLRRPEVQGAIAALGLDRIQDQALREQLNRLGPDLAAVAGGRVLWIDDRPHKILGERRLLRALGVEVVSAISSAVALQILEEDNDFDLMLSDVQREDDTYLRTGGVRIHGGVNLVVMLRQHEDPTIRSMPVVFYAAYEWARLVEFTRPAREIQPEAEISNRVIDLVPKVVRRLVEARSRPITAKPLKEATSVMTDRLTSG